MQFGGAGLDQLAERYLNLIHFADIRYFHTVSAFWLLNLLRS